MDIGVSIKLSKLIASSVLFDSILVKVPPTDESSLFLTSLEKLLFM